LSNRVWDERDRNRNVGIQRLDRNLETTSRVGDGRITAPNAFTEYPGDALEPLHMLVDASFVLGREFVDARVHTGALLLGERRA